MLQEMNIALIILRRPRMKYFFFLEIFQVLYYVLFQQHYLPFFVHSLGSNAKEFFASGWRQRSVANIFAPSVCSSKCQGYNNYGSSNNHRGLITESQEEVEEAVANSATVARTKRQRCRRHRENAVINYCGAHIAAWSSIQNGYFVDNS